MKNVKARWYCNLQGVMAAISALNFSFLIYIKKFQKKHCHRIASGYLLKMTFFVCLLFISQCSNNIENPTQATGPKAPVFTVLEPPNYQTGIEFAKGDTVHYVFSLEAESGLGLFGVGHSAIKDYYSESIIMTSDTVKFDHFDPNDSWEIVPGETFSWTFTLEDLDRRVYTKEIIWKFK